MDLPLPFPTSRGEIERIQSERKRHAFTLAKRTRLYKGKLDHIDINRLDEKDVWESIPILDKDTLRTFNHAQLLDELCAVEPTKIAEYWRSGGSTGQPVFYPRTAEDVRYAELTWGRSFPCMGIGPGDLCHISFPLGIHPAGQVWARSAQMFGVGMLWVGAGNSYPSAAQLDLIQSLKPTVWIGMSSFALHLANLAEAKGIDLASSSVRKLVCSAETLSVAKREKLSRSWNAEVYDVFGMSEAGLMGAETTAHDGIHIWTDMHFIEVSIPTPANPCLREKSGRCASRRSGPTTRRPSCDGIPATRSASILEPKARVRSSSFFRSSAMPTARPGSSRSVASTSIMRNLKTSCSAIRKSWIFRRSSKLKRHQAAKVCASSSRSKACRMTPKPLARSAPSGRH